MDPQQPAPINPTAPTPAPVAPLSPAPAPVVPGSPQKNNGTMIIIAVLAAVIVIGGIGAFFLLKGSKKDSNTSVDKTGSSSNSAKATVSTAAKTCLVPSDYDSLFGYENDIDYTTENMHTDNVHFLADSVDYEDASNAKSTIDNYAEWLVKIKDTKHVALILEGGTNDVNTDATSLKLAQDRADHVNDDLIAKGVPASMLSTKVQTKQNDTAIAEIDRVVVFYVDPTCDTSAAQFTTGQ